MDFSSPVLEATRLRLRDRFGALVDPWWARLPEALSDLAARWELSLREATGRGNTSLVLRCRRADGRAAVLKLTPDGAMCEAEARALRSWETSGRVPLVWGHDKATGALLLEAIASEVPLSEVRQEVGVNDVAELICALHRSGEPDVADGVVSLADRVEFIFSHWVERYGRHPAVARVVAVQRLEAGRELARALAVDTRGAVLLHGDLHPGNVLDGGRARGLVAIDPRPCVGDAAFDAVDWVFWAAADAESWEHRCRELAAALGVDRQRLWMWCCAFAAMLAAGTAAHGGAPERVQALMALAP